MSTTAALDGCRKLSILLLLSAPAFSGCETPQEPTDEPAPASPAHSAANDSRTLLLLRFNEKLTGLAGEQPTQASGLTFETGVLGSGVLVNGTDQLAYSTSGNIKAAAGTVEFWIKPRWNGNDHLDHWFFSIPGVLRVGKDAADNLRFILLGDDSEAGIAKNLGDWVANEWHFVAVTWTVPGAMKTYVDGIQVIAHASRAQDLITPMPAEMLVGSESGRLQARGVAALTRLTSFRTVLPGGITA